LRWGAESSSGLPLGHEEARAFLQGRIALFGRDACLLICGILAAVLVATAIAPSVPTGAWVPLAGAGRDEVPITLAAAGVMGVTWLVCRSGRRSARALLLIDAIASFLACVCASLPVLLPGASPDHKYRMLLAISNGLIVRAAVIPGRARRTMAISGLASTPVIWFTGLFHAARGGTALDVAAQTMVSAMWMAIAVFVAAFTSRVIYGLHRQVRLARQLGQYTLLEKVGAGGMGEVYRARHAMLRRPTAVKLLPPGKSGEEGLRRFEREVQLTAILTHPNTVHVYDYGRTPEGVFYYAMEYLEGVNLDDLVREDGPQDPARVAHILKQVCGALAEAHGIGLIHRDVKPANVILCQRGGQYDVAKILDFGLVRELHADGAPELTHAGAIAGTPRFLSPEAIRTPKDVDGRSDLYSLGAVAFYLLTAHHLFEGDTFVEVCSHHLHSPPARPTERLGSAVPADLEDAVLDCLQKDPQRRPRTALELLGRLEACRELGRWGDEEARAWWTRRGERLRHLAPARPPRGDTGLSQAMTVDHEGRWPDRAGAG
jgi:serine/threonine-protein kinase